jgi:hypothetical protein
MREARYGVTAPNRECGTDYTNGGCITVLGIPESKEQITLPR